MKASIIFVGLIAIALISSSSAKVEIPACMQKMIDGFNGTPRLSPYIRIDSYLYRGKMTFLASSSCCDRFNPLFDGECKQICAPSGGFIGRGDGKCMDFGEKATKMENIWIVPRA
ncbi:unnamed protein product [Rotaria sordida]|uniref:DUF6970 domain-containing protein n=1 Tax=Rotaria sordida TaxID=392033 RepID=A0A819CVM5_9BILA|nr:unnamed protein product [Rotaria sordida]CAF1037922.1 unnamed protein product [Rotaria sordida]CAF1113812.1 unnamed protein product [Rotaria sordida]CAF3747741.1 unnamed protein product [Rotaria sordida]CAF3822438.1 unnamed protein product [Rotaria sordida]